MHTLRKLPSSNPVSAATDSSMAKEIGTQAAVYATADGAAKMLIMDRTPTALPQGTASPNETRLQEVFTQAVALMARLRAPGGCPWDREQTFDSIRRYTLEETYEVLDAIERRDWPGLKDELGDLLLQVLFYAEMAQESAYFRLEDVIENLNAKLVRRHPHVFAEGRGVGTSAQVLAQWEAIKSEEAAERNQGTNDSSHGASLLSTIPRGLPALMEASKLGSKAASIGFDWSEATPVFEKLEEELAELRTAIQKNDRAGKQEEIGDVLFTVVNLARKLGVQAELALRGTNAKFRHRFAAMEASAGGRALHTLSSDEMEQLWTVAKQREHEAASS